MNGHTMGTFSHAKVHENMSLILVTRETCFCYKAITLTEFSYHSEQMIHHSHRFLATSTTKTLLSSWYVQIRSLSHTHGFLFRFRMSKSRSVVLWDHVVDTWNLLCSFFRVTSYVAKFRTSRRQGLGDFRKGANVYFQKEFNCKCKLGLS